MRIGVLTSLYPSSAFPVEGVFAERRWQGMAARGHAVDVVHPLPWSPQFPGVEAILGERRAWLAKIAAREERSGISVHHPRYLHLPRAARGNAERFGKAGLRPLLANAVPDVVVCDYAWPAAAAARRLVDRGVGVVVSGRGSDVLQVAGEAGLASELARGLRAAGHWIAVSGHLLARMDELGGGHGSLVPNGVDLELFAPGDRSEARAGLGLDAWLPDGAPLVLVAGHLIPRKDPLLALDAFAQCRAEGARLVFVGRGPLGEELRARAEALGLADRVRLAGETSPDGLARWYAACDALLLTSSREGRPNVVLEALASGRPVVATAAGGTAELFEGADPDLAGGVLPEGERDAVAIGRRLSEVLATARASSDPDGAAEARRALVRPLSWARSLDTLEACLARAARP